MEASIRHRLSPIAGFVSLVLGLGFIAALQFCVSFFKQPPTAPASSAVGQPLAARPSGNPTAPLKLELSCYDPHVLPIWPELKKDFRFRESLKTASGSIDCSEILQLKKINLDRAGTDEVFVRGKGPVFCGGNGNCDYWIFGIKGGLVRKLLAWVHEADAYEFGVDEIQRSRSGIYPDIMLASRDGQHVLHFQSFRFDGKEYVEFRCMSEVPKLLRNGAGSRELITCDEFARQRDEAREALRELADIPAL